MSTVRQPLSQERLQRSPMKGRADTQNKVPTAKRGKALNSQPSSHTVKSTFPTMSDRSMSQGSWPGSAMPRVSIAPSGKIRATSWV